MAGQGEAFVHLRSIESCVESYRIPSSDIPSNCRVVEEFDSGELLISGRFGPVYVGRDSISGESVNLKRFGPSHDARSLHSLREIRLLTSLTHRNIVCLKDVAMGKKSGVFYMVLEPFAPFEKWKVWSQPYPFGAMKCLLRGVLKSLEYLHGKSVVHRGVELNNLALGGPSVHNLLVKLGGFRFARKFTVPLREEQLTPEETDQMNPCTKPPEQLLGSKYLDPATDMWATGCLFADLVGDGIVPGEPSPAQQLDQMVDIFGTPTESIWPGVSKLPLFKEFKFKEQPYNNIKNVVGDKLGDSGLLLLQSLLLYDPRKRPTPHHALQSEFFEEEQKAFSSQELGSLVGASVKKYVGPRPSRTTLH